MYVNNILRTLYNLKNPLIVRALCNFNNEPYVRIDQRYVIESALKPGVELQTLKILTVCIIDMVFSFVIGSVWPLSTLGFLAQPPEKAQSKYFKTVSGAAVTHVGAPDNRIIG